jgi:ParB family chromosome partitioning protein
MPDNPSNKNSKNSTEKSAEKKVDNNSKATASNDNDKIITIDITKVDPDPNQPRKYFDTLHLDNLKHSIETISQIEPILVRVNESIPGNYFIIDGERRWRALKSLNHKEVKCRIISIDSVDYEIISLTQNIHREDLLPVEKSLALAKLLKKMKGENEKVRQRQLIKKVNLSETYISELLKISTLDEEIKSEALKSNYWSGAKLLLLSKIKDKAVRFEKFEEFKAKILKKIEKKVNPHADKTDMSNGEFKKTKRILYRHFENLVKRLDDLIDVLEKETIDGIDFSHLDIIMPKLNRTLDLIKTRLSHDK